jgi:hypothetical protein
MREALVNLLVQELQPVEIDLIAGRSHDVICDHFLLAAARLSDGYNDLISSCLCLKQFGIHSHRYLPVHERAAYPCSCRTEMASRHTQAEILRHAMENGWKI